MGEPRSHVRHALVSGLAAVLVLTLPSAAFATSRFTSPPVVFGGIGEPQ